MENLKALVYGRKLNNYQRSLAIQEFEKLQQSNIVLKYTKTHENCPKGCKEISYLHDDQEHKSCIKCGCKWNRITNEVVR